MSDAIMPKYYLRKFMHKSMLEIAIIFLLLHLTYAGHRLIQQDKKSLFSLADSNLANNYLNLGIDYSQKADFDSSIFFINKGREIYEDLASRSDNYNLWIKCVECYNLKGNNLRKIGKYDEAMADFNKALKFGFLHLEKNHEEIANSYNRIGIVHIIKGDLDKATEYFNKSLSVAKGRYAEITAKNLNNIGIVHVEKGEYDQALVKYNECLTIRKKILRENHSDIGACYNNIGNVYWYLGDYDKALEYYRKDLLIQKNVYGDDHPEVAETYHNMGMVYSRKGEFDKALGFWAKALKIRLKTFGGRHWLVSSTYFNMGRCYLEKGVLDSALICGEKSLEIRMQIFGETHESVAQSYNHLASVYLKKNDTERALAYLNKTLKIRQKILGNFHPDLAQTYYDIAQVYESRNDIKTALHYCQKSIAAIVPRFDDQSIYNNPDLDATISQVKLLYTLKLKANLLNQQAKNINLRDLKMSLSTYELTSNLIIKMRLGYKAEGSKLFIGETQNEVYEQAIQVCFALYEKTKITEYKNKAFSLAEESKSTVLQQSINDARAKEFAGIPNDLLDKERQLRIELAFYDTQIQKERLKGEKGDLTKINRYENLIFTSSQKYDELIQQFEQHYPSYYDLKYKYKPADITDFQEHLSKNTVVLDYFLSKNNVYIFIISKDKFNSFAVPIDSSFISSIKLCYSALRTADKQNYRNSSIKLSKVLVEPIKTEIMSFKHLLIIPHDLLYKIPFEVLPMTPDERQGISTARYAYDYLIKHFSIAYHYSVNLYLDNLVRENQNFTRNKNIPKTFIGFAPVFDSNNNLFTGTLLQVLKSSMANVMRSLVVDGERFNALPHSEHEVTTSAGLFTNKFEHVAGAVFLHSDATEVAFKQQIKNYRIIHIATHSFVNEDDPARSGIIFSQPNRQTVKDDGLLYSGETYNLDMDADLVVLSSCESGLGKMIRGEGMLSLTRGFLYSGARNVLFSLWKIPDKSTSDLMIEFYRQLLSGKTMAESLRQAKLKAIMNPVTEQPRSWAGFILIGSE